MADSDIFLIIGLISLAIFVVQTVLSFFSGHDVHHSGLDFGHGHDGGDDSGSHDHNWPGFLSYFTLRNLVAFTLGYGWVGYASIKTGFPGFLAVLTGIAAGLAFVYAIFKLMKALHRLESDATIDLHDAIGQLGEVYLEIEENSPGKIVIELGGVNQELSAVCLHPGRLAKGTPIRVIGLEGNYLQVERA